MDFRKELFSGRDPYDTEGTDALFAAAVRENARYHAAHCPEYRAILEDFGFSPDELQTTADLGRLPFLPTAFLKTHRLFSMPRARMPIVASSSGTSGKASEIGMDFGSLVSGAKMVRRVFAPRGILSARPCHYVVFGYEPRISNRAAAAKTAFGYTFLAPALSRVFALRYREGKYVPDLDAVIRAFERQEKSPFPTRTIGFPAYTVFAMKRMRERGIRLRLPPGSKIMLGGGWKQFWREAVDKNELYRLAEETLGVPEDEIIECYGAAEHPILYCDCARHHFHIPIYSRVLIRDARTLEVLPIGRVGLVNLITPMIRATPVTSVLTDDLGILHPAEECGCGVKSPWLEILGRVGLADVKTCAAGAAELLGEGAGT
ncbi:MAG: acyl-protein synthetase [Clostridia bacterium]|nr:acyl-protein synthetase [Clostridia bacterium]